MSSDRLKVVDITRPPSAFDPTDIRTLDGRYRCIVGIQGHLYTAVLCAEKLSPSKEFIFIGDYYSDHIRGWFRVEQLTVQEVIAKIEPKPEPAPRRPWWRFWP